MRKLAIIILVLFSLHIKSQPIPGCNQSTVVPAYIFPPNTTTTITPTTFFPNDIAYLCGPNTMVYDTVSPQTSFVFVNSGCTYITNGGSSIFYCVYYVKNNGTVIIRPDASPNVLSLVVEPTATVINQTTLTISTSTCSNIVFPTISCFSLIKDQDLGKIISISPNPSLGFINISIHQNNFQNPKLEIINYLGQTVLKTEFKNQIDVSELASGFYTLLIKDNSGTVLIKKFVKE